MDPWSLYFIQTSLVFPNVLVCPRTPHDIYSSCPHGLLWLWVSQACLALDVFELYWSGRLQDPPWLGFVWCLSHDQNETGFWEEDHTNQMPLSLYHIEGAQHHSPGWGRCHCVHRTLQDGGWTPPPWQHQLFGIFCIGGWSLFSHYTIFPCKILPVFCMLKIFL